MAIDFATLGITVKSDDVPRATGELDKLSAAGQRSERAMALMQIRANAMNDAFDEGKRHLGVWDSIHQQAAGHVGEHSFAIGRLEKALATIVGHFIGANNAAELLGSGLLKFSIGSLETLGILGGLALMVGLYEKMTEGARAAKKQMDDMTDSLVKQAAAAYQATIAGRANLSLIADMNAEAVKSESGVGWRSILGSILSGRPGISATDADRQAGRIANVTQGQDQARANEAKARKDSYDEQKRKDEEAERKREAAARKAQEDFLRYQALMGRVFGNADNPLTRGERAASLADWNKTITSPTAQLMDSMAIGKAVDKVITDEFTQGNKFSMPNVTIWDGLTKAQQRHIEATQAITERYERAKDVFSSTSNAVENFKEGIKSAATSVLEKLSPSHIVQGLVGGAINMVDSAIHSLVGNAVGGVRHAIFGQSSEERTAMRLAQDSAKALALGLDAVTQSLGRNALGAAIDGLKIGLISTLQGINTALPGKKFETERNAARDLAILQEAQQEAQLRAQFAANTKYAVEDLTVRNLRATGRSSEADLQAFKNQQEREMAQAILDGRDATYMLNLTMTQSNELTAYQNGLLATALRNAPTGFYGIAGYQGQYATPRGPTDAGPAVPYTGRGSPSQPVTIILQVDGKILTRTVVSGLDQFAAATGGAGSARSDALNRMPLS